MNNERYLDPGDEAVGGASVRNVTDMSGLSRVKRRLKNFGMLNFALQDPAGTNVDVLQPIALISDFWSLKCDTVTARRLFHHFSFFSVSLLVD